MNIIKGMGDFFALDIGTSAIRIAQLQKNGNGWRLLHSAEVPVDYKVAIGDSEELRNKLAEVIMTAYGQSGITTKDVVVNIPSEKTFSTVADVPIASSDELNAMMKYQVEQYIPSSLDDTRVDWALLGPSLKNTGQMEVFITSVKKEYNEQRLEMVESIGLNVIATEPDSLAMVRALSNPDYHDAGMLIFNIGENSTDLAIVYEDAPRILRTIPIGLSTLVNATVQGLKVQPDQARQFILRFGLTPDKLNGEVANVLSTSIDNFVAEVNKTVKFFETRYPSIPVKDIVGSGFASTIPMFDQVFSQKMNKPMYNGDIWRDIQMTQEQKQALQPMASEFATVIGLAKRSGL